MRIINYPCNRDQAFIFRRFVHLRFSLRKILAWGRGYSYGYKPHLKNAESYGFFCEKQDLTVPGIVTPSSLKTLIPDPCTQQLWIQALLKDASLEMNAESYGFPFVT